MTSTTLLLYFSASCAEGAFRTRCLLEKRKISTLLMSCDTERASTQNAGASQTLEEKMRLAEEAAAGAIGGTIVSSALRDAEAEERRRGEEARILNLVNDAEMERASRKLPRLDAVRGNSFFATAKPTPDERSSTSITRRQTRSSMNASTRHSQRRDWVRNLFLRCCLYCTIQRCLLFQNYF